jgi:hypothetical protein
MAQVPQATREAGCLEGISSDTQWEFLELGAARHARMSGASRSQERDDFGANLREESKSPARVWGCSICAAPSARALVEPVGGLLFEGPSNHRVRRPSPVAQLATLRSDPVRQTDHPGGIRGGDRAVSAMRGL